VFGLCLVYMTILLFVVRCFSREIFVLTYLFYLDLNLNIVMSLSGRSVCVVETFGYGFFSVAYCMFRVMEPFRVVFTPAMLRVSSLKFSSTVEAFPAILSIISSKA